MTWGWQLRVFRVFGLYSNECLESSERLFAQPKVVRHHALGSNQFKFLERALAKTTTTKNGRHKYNVTLHKYQWFKAMDPSGTSTGRYVLPTAYGSEADKKPTKVSS